MKKTLTLLFALMLGCISANAVPAMPGVKRTVTLADGTKVELTLRGDEHYKFYTGNDGFAYREKGKQFVRLSLEDARTQWSERIAMTNKSRKARTRGIGDANGSMTGKRKGLVILMEFADVKFTTENVLDVYKDFFNKENYTDNGMNGSVSDYFKAQSYGNFELDFDVVGPFTANANMEYYGAHYTDDNGEEQHDSHPAGLVHEACLKADSLVNFADYDWDGDGEVDQVFVVYAGYAEAQGGAPETIWPHEWALEGEGIKLDLDGVHISTYACSCELRGASGTDLDGIGTACHEFTHCLGLPDFYDTNGQNNFGMAYWDVMDAGSYNDNSRTPAGYTSYERWFAGWLTPKELNGDMTQVSNMKALVDEPEAYILYNEANKNEYYLLENRQKRGFDAGLYGHGLLVLHVDYNKTAWSSNTVNTNADHQRLTIIAADNEYKYNSAKSLAGDPFPGTSGVTALTNSSTPEATLYNANTDGTYYMNKAIDHITESEEGLISFVALRPEMPAPSITEAQETEGEGSFTITWPAVEGALSYQLKLTETSQAADDPAEALQREFNFDEFVSKTAGYTDLSSKMGDYGLSGWTGSKIFSTPNKMRIGTSKETGHVRTATWDVPSSTEFTVVVGAGLFKDSVAVKGTVEMYHYNKGDNTAEGETQKFELKEDGMMVFNFNSRDEKFWITINPESQMYLNYLAVYDGTWTASQLGLAAAARQITSTRGAKETIFDTPTNSITLDNLNTDSKYYYCIRAIGEDGNSSRWTEEKSFAFSSSGIANILLNNNTESQKIFDLQGRSYGTDANGLKKGIYIIGGKKVVK